MIARSHDLAVHNTHAVQKSPINAAKVLDHQVSVLLPQAAMPTANLGGRNANRAAALPANDRFRGCQPDHARACPAPFNNQLYVHRCEVPKLRSARFRDLYDTRNLRRSNDFLLLQEVGGTRGCQAFARIAQPRKPARFFLAERSFEVE